MRLRGVSNGSTGGLYRRGLYKRVYGMSITTVIHHALNLNVNPGQGARADRIGRTVNAKPTCPPRARAERRDRERRALTRVRRRAVAGSEQATTDGQLVGQKCTSVVSDMTLLITFELRAR